MLSSVYADFHYSKNKHTLKWGRISIRGPSLPIPVGLLSQFAALSETALIELVIGLLLKTALMELFKVVYIF